MIVSIIKIICHVKWNLRLFKFNFYKKRDIMMELIDCIYIHENGDIAIKFKFEDELKNLLLYRKYLYDKI